MAVIAWYRIVSIYLWSSMCEERLNGLGISSIENDRAGLLYSSKIINKKKKAYKQNVYMMYVIYF